MENKATTDSSQIPAVAPLPSNKSSVRYEPSQDEFDQKVREDENKFVEVVEESQMFSDEVS